MDSVSARWRERFQSCTLAVRSSQHVAARCVTFLTNDYSLVIARFHLFQAN
jgi:hypothetical protein